MAGGIARVVVVIATDAVREAAERHHASPAATVALGRGAMAGLLLATLTKDDERVSVTGKMSGTNQGTLMGMPATGRTVSFAYMDLYAIADGKIGEVWHVEDLASMMRQLGVLPSS